MRIATSQRVAPTGAFLVWNIRWAFLHGS